MDSAEILQILKELTLDLESGKRKRAETVEELHRRIEPDLVYNMDAQEPQREFINQVFVSLDNLTDVDFPPAESEMKYFAECFRGQREFDLEEVRKFELVPTAVDEPSDRERRPRIHSYNQNKKTRGKITKPDFVPLSHPDKGTRSQFKKPKPSSSKPPKGDSQR